MAKLKQPATREPSVRREGTKEKTNAPGGNWRRRVWLVRPLFWLAAVLLAAWFLATIWMRWIDLIIDFGREVYLPWRVLAGEHVGRDFVHPYGPLSVYFNAALFGTFGVAIHTLIYANLVICGLTFWLLFSLVRPAFGFTAAAVATTFGFFVVGFGHHIYAANYTFAAPYSHEATHGMLLLLLLLAALARHTSHARAGRHGLLSGVLLGLVTLTKTEYVFTAGLLLAVAALRTWLLPSAPGIARRWLTAILFGLGAVWLAAWLCLCAVSDPHEALLTTVNAVIAPLRFRSYTQGAHVLSFLGADQPREHLLRILAGAALGLGVLGTAALGAWFAARSALPRLALAAVGTGCAALAVYAGIFGGWQYSGFALPALLAFGTVYSGLQIRRQWRERGGLSPRLWLRALLLVAAIGMLARMALHPKIYHYGFFQALLASTWLCGFLVGEWPRLGRSTGARIILAAASLGLIGAIGFVAVRHSLFGYRLRQIPVAEGADRFLAYHRRVLLLTEEWEGTRRLIAAESKPNDTLLVIPEGILLNYVTRRRHPLDIMDLLPATLPLHRGDVLATVRQAPPNFVVMVTRPEGAELGSKGYGTKGSPGFELVEWVRQNYEVIARTPQDPFAPGARGIWTYRRKVP